MQKLNVTTAVSGDCQEIRRRLFAEYADTKRVTTLRLPLSEFAIPGNLTLEKDIELCAWVTRDAENINEELRVDFRAASGERLFPALHGTLDVYPDDAATIIELKAQYEPPLGMLGLAIDTTVGYLIAERCMSQFLRDIATQLTTATATPAGVGER